MSLSALPYLYRLRSIVFPGDVALQSFADEVWDIAPEEVTIERPAFHLKGQIDRVTKVSEFSISVEEERLRLIGGKKRVHHATRGFLIKNALMVDGVVHKGSAILHLHARSSAIPQAFVEAEARRSALYSSFPGNKYFANWLMDDCVTYPMALEYGVPVRTALPKKSVQMDQYADMLGMKPLLSQNTYFDELVIFEDYGQNSHKLRRARELTDKLLAGKLPKKHAGVYIVRGTSGNKRVLTNEMEIAEHLNAKYGLRIVDPSKLTAMEIVDLCAGSELVVGLEGSHLIHGVQMQAQGDSLLVLQPPNRYCTVFKDLADRNQQKFGMVVGKLEMTEHDFSVAIDEMDATIDLMLSAP